MNGNRPASRKEFCGFPLDFWIGLMQLRQSMFAWGYTRPDYAVYEAGFVIGWISGRRWDFMMHRG